MRSTKHFLVCGSLALAIQLSNVHAKPMSVPELMEPTGRPTQAVAWTCHYSEPRSDEFLHLICESLSFDPVFIPIWAYDYGDGMVETLMRSALCYRATYPCTVLLDRKGANPGFAQPELAPLPRIKRPR